MAHSPQMPTLLLFASLPHSFSSLVPCCFLVIVYVAALEAVLFGYFHSEALILNVSHNLNSYNANRAALVVHKMNELSQNFV